MVEYTGFRFLFFFIGEFGTAFAFSAIAATLFLGGWALPGVVGDTVGVMRFLGPLVLFAKIMFVAFLMFWVRFTYPRLREDQLQALAWKFLIPHRPRQHPVDRRVQGGVLDEEAQAPRRHRRPRHHVQDDAEAGGHRAVPARAGRPAHAARGVIALKEENCTVCMLCARSCPDWCIYIEGHKEKRPPRREGGRERTVSVLDRFDIDYALCMYCGICVEVCPFDALFWSPEYEYSESNIAKLLHDKQQARRVDGDRPRARAARDRRRGQEVVVAQNVAFWILAVAMAGAAIGVVRSQNVVHAALYLVVVLAGAAAQYILLAAEFVAWVQVLIYIGAIVILFLFGIMLTRAPMRARGEHRQQPAPGRRGRRACSCSA